MNIATAIELRDDALNDQLWHEHIVAERLEEERQKAALEAAEAALTHLDNFESCIDELLCRGSNAEVYQFIGALCLAVQGKTGAMTTAKEVLAKYLIEGQAA